MKPENRAKELRSSQESNQEKLERKYLKPKALLGYIIKTGTGENKANIRNTTNETKKILNLIILSNLLSYFTL